MSVFGSCLLVFGPEGLIGERAAKERVSTALRERSQAQINRVEAAALDGNMLAEVTGGSLFATDSITVINDIGSLPTELTEAVLDAALNPPEELALILVHAGGVKGKGLLDKLKKSKIEVFEAAQVKPWEIAGFVFNEAKRRRMQMRQEAAQALVDAVGSDLRSLVGALDQLHSDTDGAEITESVVARYFAGRAEVSSFAVADAVLAGNANLALERLRWALSTGIAPVLVTAALASGLRGLGKFLDLRGQRMNDYDMARQIGVPPFKVKEMHRTSRGWTPRAVGQSIRLVSVADAQVKGAATDPGYALERMVLSVIGTRNTNQ